MLSALLAILQIIGPTGIILIILFFIALYLSLRSSIYLYIVERDFYREFLSLEQKPTCKTYVDASNLNPLTDIIHEILLMQREKKNINVREEVQYLFHRNFDHITKRLAYLRYISVASPLLGLLGTMLGMVTVFHTIAKNATPDSTLLANGIWEALMTTILGLCVAIPTLAFFYHLRLKLRTFQILAIEHSMRALELCSNSTQE